MTIFVFDLDDTLLAERDFVESGFRAVDAHLATRGVAGFFERAWAQFSAGARGDIFDRALAELGRATDPALIGELVTVYREHAPAIALAPDAAEVLARLDREGRGYGVITDGPLVMQRGKLRALGLDGRAAFVAATDQWGREFWKPHPRAFEAAEAALGGQGAAMVYVGDNPAKDFIAPRARGWRTVRLRRPGGEHGAAEPAGPAAAADHEIAGLEELFGLFRDWADRT